jgi:hypothetical protein
MACCLCHLSPLFLFAYLPTTHAPQVAPGRYVAVEAPRTPLTLAQTKLNASAVIQTSSPIQRWRSKEGLQDVEWDEFADLVGVVRCSSQHAPYQTQPLVTDVLLPPPPSHPPPSPRPPQIISLTRCAQERDPRGHLRARNALPPW